MIQLEIKTDIDKFTKSLHELAGDQLPWATTLALNSLAKSAQSDLKHELRRVFTIRNQYVPNSIRIQRAQKKDWPRISASVGSINPFMVNQVLGGEKKAKDQATPLGAPLAARAVKANMIPSSLWVRKLKSKKRGYFAITTANGKRLMMQRLGNGGDGLKALYVLQDTMKIKPKFKMKEIVGATVKRDYTGAFIAALEQAVRTKK